MSQGDGGGKRTENVQKYTTAKRAWSRMASFVNYEDKSRGYTGDKLARKYVLQGGTLFQDVNDSNDFALRYGVGQKNGAYGSDLGGYSKGDKFYGDRQLGLRPMPGITSITIQNKTAYGSLRQATIKYKAWTKAQLEDLEVLYMRMKYPVLLEWGWSMYMDTYDQGSTYTTTSDKQSLKIADSELSRLANSPIKSFIEPTIDPFDENQTQDDIYEKIKVLQHRFSGNYDGMLGFVENFTWELQSDGGFECTTVLISMGDVLASLKMNRPTPIRSEFEVGNSGYKSYFTQMLEDFVNNVPIPVTTQPTDPGIDKNANRLDGFTTADNKSGAAKNSLYYIQLAYFIYLLNEKNNLYDGKDKKLIELEIPTENSQNRGNGLCLASEDSVSIDPSICLVKNKKATFATGLQEGFDVGYELNNKSIFSTDPFSGNNTATIPFTAPTTAPAGDVIARDFLVEGEQAGRNFGIIGNIYISVQYIKNLFEDIGSKKDVLFYEFIKALLDKVSYALGGINDFDMFVYDNKGVIIDKNYTERSVDATTDNKFKLNIFGNHTVVRTYKVLSKIFQSQATEVAVAAANRENLGGYNTSTQRALNKGLSNRLLTNVKLPEEDKSGGSDAVLEYRERERVANSVLEIQGYLQKFLTGRTFPSEAISSANTTLKSILLSVNSDTNYKAIIPISLEVILDGIGGVDIGEIFTVEEGVLPKEYDVKHLGFIVVKESHTITSDWTTTLEGKVVLLDQNDVSTYASIKELKKSLTTIGAKLVHEKFLEAQYQVLYYRQILALIKMYYEGYFQIQAEIKIRTFDTKALSERSNSDIFESIVIKYRFIAIGKDKDAVIIKDASGTPGLAITASQILGSLTDNMEAVKNIKKYRSYARLDEDITFRQKGFEGNYTEVGYKGTPRTKRTEQVIADRLPNQFGGGTYNGENITYDVSVGYMNLIKPFQVNSKEELKQFIIELVHNSTHYKELKAPKLKQDIDSKLNFINKSLVDTNKVRNAITNLITNNTAQLAADVLTQGNLLENSVEIIPLKAEKNGNSIDYVPDPVSKFTITYE